MCLERTHGLDFKTPIFTICVIYSRYHLDEENIYMQTIFFMCYFELGVLFFFN